MGCPDRTTLTPIRYDRDNCTIALSTLSCTLPDSTSLRAAGGSSIRAFPSTSRAVAERLSAGRPGCAGWTAVPRQPELGVRLTRTSYVDPPSLIPPPVTCQDRHTTRTLARAAKS